MFLFFGVSKLKKIKKSNLGSKVMHRQEIMQYYRVIISRFITYLYKYKSALSSDVECIILCGEENMKILIKSELPEKVSKSYQIFPRPGGMPLNM